jgi:hypothetical protein
MTAATFIFAKNKVKWFYQKEGGDENAAEIVCNKLHKKQCEACCGVDCESWTQLCVSLSDTVHAFYNRGKF